jgi:hypothetical protein
LWCRSSFVPFDECDEGVEGAGDVPGGGVAFASSFVDDDSGFSASVSGLDGDVVDPAGEVEAGVVFDLDGRPVFVGDPNVATVEGCAGWDSFGFDTSDVQIVTGGTFGG